MTVEALNSKQFLKEYESCYLSDNLSDYLNGKDEELNTILDNWLDEKIVFDSRIAPKATWQLGEFKNHIQGLLSKFSKKELLIDEYGIGEIQLIPMVLLAEHLKLLKIKKVLHEPLPEHCFDRNSSGYIGFIVDILEESSSPPIKRDTSGYMLYFDLVIDNDWDYVWTKNSKKKWKLKKNDGKFYRGADRFKEMFDNQGKVIFSQSDWKSFSDTAVKNTGLDKEKLDSYKIILKGKYGLREYQ